MNSIGSLVTDREDELLLGLARTFLNEETVAHIQVLLKGNIDWPTLLQRAAHHRALPLVYRSLEQHFSALTPPDVRQALRNQYGNIVRHSLLLAAELTKVMDLLERHGICAIPYKGPAIGLLVYRNLCLRQFGDLDILIDPRQYHSAQELLRQSGYRFARDWGWESSLVDDKLHVCIDLHRAITPESFPVHLGFEELQNRVQPVTIAGRNIKVLCAEHMFIILCIQLAKDSWGQGPLRLSKICDIAELLRLNQNMEWAMILREARAMGCRRMIFLGLRVAHELLGAPLSEPVLSKARSEAQVEILASQIYRELFNHQVSGSSAKLTKSEFYFKLRERWRDKLFPYAHACKMRVTPNERDHALVQLPESLNFLYYFIRPVRLARDYVLKLLRTHEPD